MSLFDSPLIGGLSILGTISRDALSHTSVANATSDVL